MTYRDSTEARNVAAAYAWGVQDGGSGPRDSWQALSFARVYAGAHESLQVECAYHLPPLESAYRNFLAHGHVFDADECGKCGRPSCGSGSSCPAHALRDPSDLARG